MRKADNLPPSCAVVTKSGNINFLEPSGPVMGVNYLCNLMTLCNLIELCVPENGKIPDPTSGQIEEIYFVEPQ